MHSSATQVMTLNISCLVYIHLSETDDLDGNGNFNIVDFNHSAPVPCAIIKITNYEDFVDFMEICIKGAFNTELSV